VAALDQLDGQLALADAAVAQDQDALAVDLHQHAMAKLRLQIMGLAEMNFLAGLAPEKRRERLDQLFRQQPPAVIVCRSEELEPFPEMLELAQQHKVALLRSNEMTCTLMGSLITRPESSFPRGP